MYRENIHLHSSSSIFILQEILIAPTIFAQFEKIERNLGHNVYNSYVLVSREVRNRAKSLNSSLIIFDDPNRAPITYIHETWIVRKVNIESDVERIALAVGTAAIWTDERPDRWKSHARQRRWFRRLKYASVSGKTGNELHCQKSFVRNAAAARRFTALADYRLYGVI